MQLNLFAGAAGVPIPAASESKHFVSDGLPMDVKMFAKNYAMNLRKNFFITSKDLQTYNKFIAVYGAEYINELINKYY